MMYKLFFIILTLLLGFGCNNSYTGYAKKIQLKLEELGDKQIATLIPVKADSISIIILSNPTNIRLQFDTIIEQTLDEQDFVIIEYINGTRLLQRVEADDFNYQNLHFENLLFRKNDTILIKRADCTDFDETWKCNIVFKKQ